MDEKHKSLDTANTKPILIESPCLSPIHMCLQVMSWGWQHSSTDKITLNKDFLQSGGRQDENVLTADFLHSLNFLSRSFTNEILKESSGLQKTLDFTIDDDAEIVGDSGNFYFPSARSETDRKNNIRVGQPDGLIADARSLVLLEMKGYADNAGLNPGQLAKEFVMASLEAATSQRNHFLVLLVMPEKVIGSGLDIKAKFTQSLRELQERNVRAKKANVNEGKFEEFLSAIDIDGAAAHFRWISWEKIRELANSFYNGNPHPCATDIINAIQFHSAEDGADNLVFPPFSQLLKEMGDHCLKVPLYELFNGGCGFKPIEDFDLDYCKTHPCSSEAATAEARQYTAWHALRRGRDAKVWKALEDLSACRNSFYSKLLDFQKLCKDISKATFAFSLRRYWRKLFLRNQDLQFPRKFFSFWAKSE